MNKKITIIAVITIVIILIVGVGFWKWNSLKKAEIVSQKTQEEEQSKQKKQDNTDIDTSDWKTYRNERYGFEIKYPNEWMVSKYKGINGDPAVVSFTTQKMQETNNYGCIISIYFYKSVVDEPENQSKSTTIDEFIKNNLFIKKIGATKLGNNDAVDVIWGGYDAYYTVLSEKNSSLYKVFFCNRRNKESLTDVDKKVLNSFNFLR